jgi:hypothetical protein
MRRSDTGRPCSRKSVRSDRGGGIPLLKLELALMHQLLLMESLLVLLMLLLQ